MSSKPISLATALALALLTTGRVCADDPVPAPAPAPPAPAPTEKPAEKPTEKPTDKPAEKPAAERGFVGFNAVPAAALDAETKQHWHVKVDSGVVALGILKGSPAAVGGLRNGDVLLKYAGKDVPSTKDLDTTNEEKVKAWAFAFQALAQSVKVGDVVEAVVERDGKPVTIQATPITRAAMDAIQKAAADDDDGEDDDGDDDDGDEKGEKPAKTPEKPAAPKPADPEKPAEPKKDAPK